MDQILDMSVVEELLSFSDDGDPELLLDLIRMFLEDGPSKVQAVTEGLLAGRLREDGARRALAEGLVGQPRRAPAAGDLRTDADRHAQPPARGVAQAGGGDWWPTMRPAEQALRNLHKSYSPEAATSSDRRPASLRLPWTLAAFAAADLPFAARPLAGAFLRAEGSGKVTSFTPTIALSSAACEVDHGHHRLIGLPARRLAAVDAAVALVEEGPLPRKAHVHPDPVSDQRGGGAFDGRAESVAGCHLRIGFVATRSGHGEGANSRLPGCRSTARGPDTHDPRRPGRSPRRSAQHGWNATVRSRQDRRNQLP
jgi:hypothetical protein